MADDQVRGKQEDGEAPPLGFEEFEKVRTGRANPAVLNDLRIDYYGVPTPVNQIANVVWAADGHQLVITPWDRSSLQAIEKAIMSSDIGITPMNDGTVRRLPFPAPSEEGRRELVKQCREIAEHARVSVRNVRRDANNKFDRLSKDGEISEDDARRGEAEIQKVTDEYVAKIDKMSRRQKRENEVMEAPGWRSTCRHMRSTSPTHLRAAPWTRSTLGASRVTSPSSWTATGVGRRRAGCRAATATRPASTPCAR